MILRHANHEANKALKVNLALPPSIVAAARLRERRRHLRLVERQAQTRERGLELTLLQRVPPFAVEVAEHALELLELHGRQVGDGARDALVLEEGELAVDGAAHEGELVAELVVRVGGEVVVLDGGLGAARVERGQGLEEGVEGREVGVQGAHVRELVGHVALEAGEGEREGVEGEGEVVGLVGEGAAEGVFDA